MTTLWDKRIKQRIVTFDRPWYRQALELLLKCNTDQPDILEIGCGKGEFASLVMERGINYNRYTALDGNIGYIRNAITLGIDAGVADFGDPLPLKNECFDIVISLEVIEHVPNCEELINGIYRVLKPGGHFILSTPNVGFFIHRLRYLLSADIHQEGIHFRFFNKRRLLSTLQGAGFSLAAKKSCMPFLVYNTLSRHFGGNRIYLTAPPALESLFCTNFVWLLEKPL